MRWPLVIRTGEQRWSVVDRTTHPVRLVIDEEAAPVGVNPHNDYSVCLTAHVSGRDIRILDVFRRKLAYPGLRKQAERLARELQADTILIENQSSGLHLVDDLRAVPDLVNPIRRQPEGDKQARMGRISAMIEAGHLMLPLDAQWLPEFKTEILGFPNARHDDCADALSQLGIWVLEHANSAAPVFENWRVRRFDTPQASRLAFGASWGFGSHPTVLIRAFTGRWEGEPGRSSVIPDPSGPCLFIDHEVHSVGCTLDDTPALFGGSDTRREPRWKNRFGHAGIPGAAKGRIIADGARPEAIEFMKSRGFNMLAASSGPGSIEDDIVLLANYHIFVHPRCTKLIEELTSYRFEVDRQSGESLGRLADPENRVIAALRYALEGARHPEWDPGSIRTAGPRVSLGPPNQWNTPAVDFLRYLDEGPGGWKLPRSRR